MCVFNISMLPYLKPATGLQQKNRTDMGKICVRIRAQMACSMCVCMGACVNVYMYVCTYVCVWLQACVTTTKKYMYVVLCIHVFMYVLLPA